MKIAVVIPSYNEAVRLAPVLNELAQTNFDITLVDDGSTDSTSELVQNRKIIYLRHLVNRGQGAALMTGSLYAVKNGYDIIAHFDADGQHRVSDLQLAIEKLVSSDLDVVLGSRFLDKNTKFPWQKRIVLGLAKLFSRKVLLLNFSDPQSGLRVFRSSVWRKISWRKDDFQHCSEILGLVLRNNLKYAELPIQVSYFTGSAQKEQKPRMSMGLKLLLSRIFD